MILNKRVRDGEGFKFLIVGVIQWGLKYFDICILDCAPELVRLYTKYGWVPYGAKFQDVALGQKVAMMAENENLARLWRTYRNEQYAEFAQGGAAKTAPTSGFDLLNQGALLMH